MIVLARSKVSASRLAVSILLSTLPVWLGGCGHGATPVPAAKDLSLSGLIRGGQQPVSGATLQLYTVGTSGDGSAASPQIASTVQSGVGGSFSITGKYSCPTQPSYVYLVATGGNPGLAAGSNNPQLAMMSALGLCSSLTPTSNLVINEASTIGALAALYPYTAGYANVGSGSKDATAFATAFANVNEYVNIGSGQTPGPALPAGFYASSTEVNALANSVAACINSTGGVAGDGSPCGNLFGLSTPPGGSGPADTVMAVVDILKNPAQNVTAIYNLASSVPPFLPTDSVAPTNWALPILTVPTAPVFSLAPGTYVGTQSLTLSDNASEATIYYTTDGSTPFTGSTIYTGPIDIAANETVKAIAINDGRLVSTVSSSAYTITNAGVTPVITSVSAVTTAATQTITITGAGFGTLAPYTGTSNFIALYDNTKPWQAGYGSDAIYMTISSWSNNQIVITGFSNDYSGFYTLAAGDSVSVGVSNPQSGYGPSLCNGITVGSGVTTICGSGTPAAAPTFSPVAGTYTAAQAVTLTSATPGSLIYYTTDGSTPTTASLLYTAPVAVSSSETITAIAVSSGYAASSTASAAYIINAGTGIITTFAGTGTSGYYGDNGPATNAWLTSPYELAFDSNGNLYAADYGGNRVRKITPGGVITTFAGTGYGGYNGDNILATSAQLNGPNGIAVDLNGNVYISEEHNQRVRKVAAGTGIITTVAGNGIQGYAGDGYAATNAEFTDPEGITVDARGNLYIADTYGNRVRKVDASTSIITTIAGTGTAGYNGDNIAATTARLSTPYAVAVDTIGNVYISDSSNNRIRKINPAGIITTVAGNGNAAFLDSTTGTNGELNGQIGIALDTSGNLYIADQYNFRIRKLTPGGVLSTIAGTGSAGYSGDGGPALSATLRPEGVVADSAGNIYVGDGGNSVVRKIAYAGTPTATPTFSPVAGSYAAAQTVTISCATSGSTIYYTTDGSTPTTLSNVYTGPISVIATQTVKAIAIASGDAASTTGSAIYTITAPVITSVSAVSTAQTQTIVITGSGFGTHAAYSGTSSYLAFRDNTVGWQAGYGADAITTSISSWTDTQIVITGFGGYFGNTSYGYVLTNGDGATVSVYNAQTGSGPANCNIVVGAGSTPCY